MAIQTVILLWFLFLSGRVQADDAKPVQMVFKFVSEVGSKGNGPGHFYEPSGIAVDLTGTYYVADSGNDRIQKFDSRGRYLMEVGGFGWEDGQFNRPTDVDIGRGLELFVTDSQNQRIQVFNLHLRLLAVIGGRDVEGPVELGTPSGIAVSEEGEVYVSDTEIDQVVQISTYSQVDRSFGGYGYGAGSLRRPNGVAVNEKGTVFVCDNENDRIVVFDRFGNFDRSMGDDILSEPEGVCVGPQDILFVADTGHHRVVAFDLKTREIAGHIGGQGKGPLAFQSPRSLSTGKNGLLYVVDTGNNRIQILRTTLLNR